MRFVDTVVLLPVWLDEANSKPFSWLRKRCGKHDSSIARRCRESHSRRQVGGLQCCHFARGVHVPMGEAQVFYLAHVLFQQL